MHPNFEIFLARRKLAGKNRHRKYSSYPFRTANFPASLFKSPVELEEEVDEEESFLPLSFCPKRRLF